MKITRLLSILIIIAWTIVLPGCWDKVEIDDRAFVISLGVDKEGSKFVVTCTTPNLAVITGQNGDGDSVYIKQSVDVTIEGAYNELATRLNEKLNFNHTKVLILGEKLVADGKMMRKVFDHFERSPNYSRRLPILVSEGEALKLLQIKPESVKAVGSYIAEVYQNNKDDIMRFNFLDLGQLFAQLHESKGDAIITKIKEGNKDVRIGGAAVIKGFEFQGWLNDVELRSIGWLSGNSKGSEVIVEYNDIYIPYKISNSSSEIEYSMEDGKLNIIIDVSSEGDIIEYTLEPKEQLYENETIKKLEKVIEEKMAEDMEDVIRKLQREYGVDAINVQNRLKLKNKKIYLETKDQWEMYFKSAKFQINNSVNIRRIGIIK